jgi:MFS family permease
MYSIRNAPILGHWKVCPESKQEPRKLNPNHDDMINSELRTVLIQVGALLLSFAALVLGNGLQGTLLGVRAGLEGMSEKSIGIMMSAYFIGYMGGSILAPRFITGVGHIRTFAAFASIASAIALVHIIVISPIVWTILRAIHGASYAGLVLVTESWLNSCTKKRYRGRVLSIYGVVMLTAWAASQPLLNLAPPSGFILFCLISIFLSLSLVPVTLSRVRAPGIVTASRIGPRKLYAISPLGVVGVLVIGACFSAFLGMGPTFAQSIGLNKAGISAFMGITLIGALVLQWPLGYLSDRIDRRWVILGLCSGAAFVGVALVWSIEQPLWFLLVLSFLFGGLCIPAYSICVAEANDRIGEEDLVAAASSMILVYGAGSIAGPFLAGLLMAEVGPGGLFICTAAIEALFVVFAFYRIAQRGTVLKELKEKFVHVPHTSHVILQMDERGSHQLPQGEKAPD